VRNGAKNPCGSNVDRTQRKQMPHASIISIVDDDGSVREGLADLVSSMGYQAKTFRRAEQFLKSRWIRKTTCLIADVQMPEMTGLELCAALEDLEIKIPTILITAFPNNNDRERALNAGVSRYLTKPFQKGELIKCIRSTLGHAV
jgi:FixJ family two-component response regulator